MITITEEMKFQHDEANATLGNWTHDAAPEECAEWGACAQVAADEKREEEEEAAQFAEMAFGYISEEHDRSAARSERLQDNLDERAYEFGG